MEALLVGCVTFLGAEVAKKLASDVTSEIWVRFKKGWAKRFKSEPKPRDVTSTALEALAETDSFGWGRTKTTAWNYIRGAEKQAQERRGLWLVACGRTTARI